MRLSRLCIALWVSFGISSDQRNWTPKNSNDIVMQSVMSLPKCCMNCVLPALGQLGCNMGNVTELVVCFCSNMHIQKDVSQCTGTNCSNRELKRTSKGDL
ncbi:putative integral membrane protein [Erysiphe neolycopersici]|uniref:Putative integral membrane protein n=1 Tax=Erysiphe neolycopersici TaxID=212602 RepID=A0A420HRC7_9PEZI|nr:putative integral membrane protein [Erysiphe neolycopersici]